MTALSDIWRPLVAVLALAAAALLGYDYAARGYEAEIAELRGEYQASAAAQANANQEEAERNARKLADAISERDAALASAGELRADGERLREAAAGYKRRLSAAGTDTCESCRSELARCVGLLGEGASLAGEGAELSRRIAADKDAVVKIAK